jgi:hypothetical protein
VTHPVLIRLGLVSLIVGSATCGKEPAMTDQQTPRPAGAPAAAKASTQAGLELAISGATPVIHVVLRNAGASPLRLYGPVSGPDRKHHDHLRAELVSAAGRRTLRFTGDRNASEIGLVDLAPGREISDDLDLAAWATQPINGGQPLAPGDGELTMTYELSQPGVWSGRVTAGPIKIRVP